VKDERAGRYEDPGKSKQEGQSGQGFEREILIAGDFSKCQHWYYGGL